MDSGTRGSSTPAGRRSLLQRGLALVAGVTAVGAGGFATRETRAAAATPGPQRGSTRTIYGRKRPVAGDNESQIMTFGELLDSPDGRALGEYHTNRFCLATPLGVQPKAGSNLEFQVLQFDDGTLFAMRGGTPSGDSTLASAIVGGTARYAGASGSLVERPLAGGTRGHDLVQIVVTLAG